MGSNASNSGSTEHLPFFVLDILRHDALEQIGNIRNMLNDRGCIGWRDHWPHDFEEKEIVAVMPQLVDRALVEAIEIDQDGTTRSWLSASDLRRRQDLGDVWFHLTEKGLALWDTWDPPD